VHANGVRFAKIEHVDGSSAPLKPSYTSSTTHTSLSPESDSPESYHQTFQGVLTLSSPTSTVSNNTSSLSPLKRALPDELFCSSVRRRTDSSSKPIKTSLETTYNLYGYPGSYSQYSSTTWTANTAATQQNVPTSVTTESKRIADSYAGAIPSDKLLEPAVWREHFFWPNEETTTQCACLMRYFIEKLAPWVSEIALIQ
jgi:hypothetical protein